MNNIINTFGEYYRNDDMFESVVRANNPDLAILMNSMTETADDIVQCYASADTLEEVAACDNRVRIVVESRKLADRMENE